MVVALDCSFSVPVITKTVLKYYLGNINGRECHNRSFNGCNDKIVIKLGINYL